MPHLARRHPHPTESTVAAREADIEELACRGRAQEELRRQMHETISELKGNIRVYCRVRPSAPSTTSANDAPTTRMPAGQLEPTNLELVPPPPSDGSGKKGAVQRFKFDRIFGESATQADIFHEVSQLTQSAIDGYKVCIFAYGQTGSGKTFTMEGAGGESRGVVPRAAEQVFGAAQKLQLLGWSFEFAASFLEIYNDELRDLLPAEGGSGSAGSSKLKISDANGVVTVPGLRSARVEDSNQLEALMTAATKVRSTSATKCNEHSSRSHYIFRMRLSGKNAKTGDTTEGELNLVDLAGSERT